MSDEVHTGRLPNPAGVANALLEQLEDATNQRGTVVAAEREGGADAWRGAPSCGEIAKLASAYYCVMATMPLPLAPMYAEGIAKAGLSRPPIDADVFANDAVQKLLNAGLPIDNVEAAFAAVKDALEEAQKP